MKTQKWSVPKYFICYKEAFSKYYRLLWKFLVNFHRTPYSLFSLISPFNSNLKFRSFERDSVLHAGFLLPFVFIPIDHRTRYQYLLPSMSNIEFKFESQQTLKIKWNSCNRRSSFYLICHFLMPEIVEVCLIQITNAKEIAKSVRMTCKGLSWSL